MRNLVFALILLFLSGCVEKNYTPEELEAQSRGNKFHWLYNKAMGVEIPSGWKLLTKGYKAEFLSRISGGADYVIFREDTDGMKLPVITIKVDNLKTVLTRKTIKEQVAREELVQKGLNSIGIYKYNLSYVKYDEQKNIFRWDADYKIYTRQDMYAGHGPSTRLDLQYAGIPRYRDVTQEIYLKRAHFFIDQYEVMLTLGEGVVYFSDSPVKFEAEHADDFNAVINSIVFK